MKSWKDIYQLPLKKDEYGSWVYDKKRNFVFEFETNREDYNRLLLDVINGKKNLNTDTAFVHRNGEIINTKNDTSVILIRGWGDLTGIGGHNLKPEEAANIQDTFAEYIVERLNFRDINNNHGTTRKP